MASGQTEGKRSVNMDILRMISMMMVTMLHALTKSDLLPFMGNEVSANGWIAWVFEALSVPAVNVFMLISGYFLISSRFKIRRLVEIVLQTLFYSVGFFVLFLILGKVPSASMNIYNFFQYFLPIHMEMYWFISVYVIIYLLLPLIISGVHAMTEKQLQGVIWWLMVFECVIKSFLPVRLSMDTGGYSFLWYLTLFLVGARIRLYGFKIVKTANRGWFLYIVSTFLILAEIFIVSQIQVRTGRLKEMTTVSLEYNHILVFSSAIGVFAVFLYASPPGEKLERKSFILSKSASDRLQAWKCKLGRLVCRLSPYCLGVYLLQENLMMRYLWQDWFGLREIMEQPIPVFVFRVLGAVVVMFVLGIFVDMFRSALFRVVMDHVVRKDKNECWT